MLTLTFLFCGIAFLYSTVGFGGGSSYIALLAASGVSYTLIPKISLICNILVVGGSCIQYAKKGYFSKSLLLPITMGSVPAAFLGGMIPLREKTFFIFLTLVLLLSGFRLLFLKEKPPEAIQAPGASMLILAGAFLGLLSGMVGIGGGIFLSPLLIHLGWARSKNAAAVASVFILLNSLSGLAGQFTKNADTFIWKTYVTLFIAVMIGGYIGSRVGSHSKISYALIQKGTGVLTLIICGQLLLKIFA